MKKRHSIFNKTPNSGLNMLASECLSTANTQRPSGSPQASPNLSSLAERGHLEVPGVAPSSHRQPSWRPSPSCLLPECPSGWFSLQVSLRERWSKGSTWWPLLSQKQSRLQQRPLRSQAAPPRPLTLVPRCHRWECKAPALETCLNEKHWHCCQMGLHLNPLGS